ncbi:MAG: hypothetical protein H6721_19430 [Sandaracinus sp.]|nr:hypothetical protein [Sandaracinus sp.]MCB9624350.1 hypothetical protein [Sandaracinus sp.]MCB9634302.1 hypothetical protein [Sandaracinus sp.]
MNWMLEERRQRRSPDRTVALRFQLEHTRDKGRIEALVLTDSEGLVVAHAGDDAVCEELGAIAPLVPRTLGMPMPPLLRGGEVAVRSFLLDGQELYLASLGGNVARDALLANSSKGLRRILGCN